MWGCASGRGGQDVMLGGGGWQWHARNHIDLTSNTRNQPHFIFCTTLRRPGPGRTILVFVHFTRTFSFIIAFLNSTIESNSISVNSTIPKSYQIQHSPQSDLYYRFTLLFYLTVQVNYLLTAFAWTHSKRSRNVESLNVLYEICLPEFSVCVMIYLDTRY